jgi:hypothetical protein
MTDTQRANALSAAKLKTIAKSVQIFDVKVYEP